MLERILNPDVPDAWIIEKIRKEREREDNAYQRIPLHIYDVPIPIREKPPEKQYPERGVIIIDFNIDQDYI